MKATLLLADYAQVADGKLNLIGAGWSITGPQPSPFALAVLILVPWDRTNERHGFQIELLDADGHPVIVPTPEGEAALVVAGEFEVGRPPGLRRGTPLDVPLAINLPPQPFPPGDRFEWRLMIDGETQRDWRVAFSTRAAGPPTS